MKVTSQKKLQIEERRKRVSANILSGANYRDIAGALDVSIGTIASDMKAVFNRLKKEQVENVDQVVTLELRRIDIALNAIFSKVQSGEVRYIETMLKLMEQRAKYLGLYELERRDVDSREALVNIETIRENRWRQIQDELLVSLGEGREEPSPEQGANDD